MLWRTAWHFTAAHVAAAREKRQQQLEAFTAAIQEINSRLDFRVSSRGWCYLLENQGAITKGEFNRAQDLINECRKSGLLPIDICAEDSSRRHDHLEFLHTDDPEEYLRGIGDTAIYRAGSYTPLSFWEDKDVYLEMLVEKIDLKSLFSPICRKYRIPLANSKGWPDIHSRYAMLECFQDHELDGRQCILLYCGDHDPAGLQISATLRAMFYDLEDAAGWIPDIEIVRFGLNATLSRRMAYPGLTDLRPAAAKTWPTATTRTTTRPTFKTISAAMVPTKSRPMRW